ncbi:unnamed protein product (macronuclear) [Paramecium tetraurelia]|uniref:Transmembrane protein n=1 Tax=Paramecium tetraurelia TaxID=5888 RepID=A0BMM4_PARTE|nr:uncharacterized protein GSPATT00030427001 [Paramecium tetraurelia]CAK59791.1 unnamed protein product [Paramecium tetraurelia]|eukprot:XP_001427189.1 hypothetical protein (macronuclear) [Paramecium tetraurelia strain d4-2]
MFNVDFQLSKIYFEIQFYIVNFIQHTQFKLRSILNNYTSMNVNDTQFTIALFEFDVLFLDTAQILLNLSISINQGLIDNNNMPVDLPTQTILLQKPKVLTQEQINVAKKFKNFGNALMIGLGAVSVLMLFVGDSQSSVEIFDTLQQQIFRVRYPNLA